MGSAFLLLGGIMAVKSINGYYKIKSATKNFVEDKTTISCTVYETENDRVVEKTRPASFFNFITTLQEKERVLTKELEDSVSSRCDINSIREEDLETTLTQKEKDDFEYLKKFREDLWEIAAFRLPKNYLEEHLTNGLNTDWLVPVNKRGEISLSLDSIVSLEISELYTELKERIIGSEDC